MISYDFSVLRYSFDPLTEEFINVGVVVYSQSAGFLQAKVNTNYGRASKIFGRLDGARYRFILRHLQSKLDEMTSTLPQGHLFLPAVGIETALSKILPIDDSSFRFDRGGTGVAESLAGVCEKLYRRYVVGNESGQVECRDRDDVWRTFRRPLERLAISNRLEPKVIVAQDYKYDFEHAWKNGIWNVYEPISFDLLEEYAIREKANKWLGRLYSLRDSPEKFKMTFLLGAPQSTRMKNAFRDAENILNKVPGKKEIIREDDAEAFARELQSQLNKSNAEHPF